jgi:hypothetical protein
VVAALATLGTTNVAPAVATIAPSIRLDLMERRGVVISISPSVTPVSRSPDVHQNESVL